MDTTAAIDRFLAARRPLGGDAARVRLRSPLVRRLARAARSSASRTSTPAPSPTGSATSGAAATAWPRRRSRAASRPFAPAFATHSGLRRCQMLTLAEPLASAPRRARSRPRSRRSSRSSKGDSPLALRNRALLELLYSAGLRSAEAVSLDLGDVDFDRELVHVRGKGGKERVVPLGEEAALHVARYLQTGRPALAVGANDAIFLSVRGRRLDTSTVRRLLRHPHRLRHCVRDASPRGRRRPPRHPGAPRARVALDDADLQPRRRAPPSARLRPLASRSVVATNATGRRRAHERALEVVHARLERDVLRVRPGRSSRRPAPSQRTSGVTPGPDTASR